MSLEKVSVDYVRNPCNQADMKIIESLIYADSSEKFKKKLWIARANETISEEAANDN